jgi:hypothetical protein
MPRFYLVTIGGLTRQTHRHTRPAVHLLLHVHYVAGTCLQNRCLAMIEWVHFTEPFPNNDRRDTHTDAQTDGRNLCSMPLRWAQVS